ncbi:MAG TPA: hypothetical protein VG317_05080 [Pseudonocardiaceae bacterium]|jgi:hypothetical protein|nr:hypothetical protein [Pseudonocardiaceae bacterium]
MFTSDGIAVNAWVTLDDSCSLSCALVGEQAQFEFGNSTGSLNLITSEIFLVRLAQIASKAVEKFRAIPDGEDVDVTVTE